MSSKWTDSRPMSPHLQIWRWHPAMASSILHRASAIISFIGLILVAIGLLVMSFTAAIPMEGLVYSPLGAIGLFIFVWAFIFMALAQLRHAIWGRGKMMEPGLNNMLSYVMIFGSIILAFIVTFIATGAL